MIPTSIIWQTPHGDATTFEYEYLTNILFKNLTYEKYFDHQKYEILIDNSIIIYSCNSHNIGDDFRAYLDRFQNSGYKFSLVHLSNENLEHNIDYYAKANRVYRNYYDSNIKLDNVVFIPLGFKSGFYNTDINNLNVVDTKTYEFCFIGHPKADRFDMLNILDKYNTYKHLTNNWNCPTSLNIDQCKNIYYHTKFAPCPMGFSHPDSFRFMEALESGCIPIIKKYGSFDYHTKIWGDTPIPKVNDWNEIDNIALMDDVDYKNLHYKVFSWYKNYRNNVLTNLI